MCGSIAGYARFLSVMKFVERKGNLGLSMFMHWNGG